MKETYACRNPEGLNLGKQTGNHDAGELATAGALIVFKRICRSIRYQHKRDNKNEMKSPHLLGEQNAFLDELE